LPVIATDERISREFRAERMLRGQANRMTYVKQLLRDSCCETVDELQRMMNKMLSYRRETALQGAL